MRIAAKVINFTSDTVTYMSSSMLNALSNAQVLGDDVAKSDVVVKQLEQRCADLFGMEKGLFFPTGTMGNLAGILAHCSRGESVILGEKSHINFYEQGGISSLGGVFPSTIPNNEDGTMDIDMIKQKLFPEDVHFPRPKVLSLENTHNYRGGVALPLSYLSQVDSIPLIKHVDGARIWNAYYFYKQSNPDIKYPDILKGVTSISVCFSKGLRCPLGTVLCGPETYIQNASRIRKVLGGGMRQPGYIAAAALDSLDKAEEIITEDHKKAKVLAKGLRDAGCEVKEPNTNIIALNPPRDLDIQQFHKTLRECNIFMGIRPFKEYIRAVTHSCSSYEDIEETCEVIKSILATRS